MTATESNCKNAYWNDIMHLYNFNGSRQNISTDMCIMSIMLCNNLFAIWRPQLLTDFRPTLQSSLGWQTQHHVIWRSKFKFTLICVVFGLV